jgi:hypothetical protein
MVIRSRFLRVGVGILIALGVGTGVVLAGLTSHSGPTSRFVSYHQNREALVVTDSKSTTSSTAFSEIPGLDQAPISNRGASSVTFSGTFANPPVQVRAVAENRVLSPGRATFDVGNAAQAVSFTFASTGSKSKCRHYEIQWRSPTGQQVGFLGGDFVIHYHQVTPPGHMICE